MPAAGVCLSPWVDLEGIGESMDDEGVGFDPMVRRRRGLMDYGRSTIWADLE